MAAKQMKFDVDARTARLQIPNVLDSSANPILNPVTGKPHRARVTLPNGFEYTEAEYGRGSTRTTGDIALDFIDTHAHLARIHWSTHGVVRRPGRPSSSGPPRASASSPWPDSRSSCWPAGPGLPS